MRRDTAGPENILMAPIRQCAWYGVLLVAVYLFTTQYGTQPKYYFL